MARYICDMCGWIFDPAEKLPRAGVMPGTPFEDVPETFCCPSCGASKRHFSPRDGHEEQVRL